MAHLGGPDLDLGHIWPILGVPAWIWAVFSPFGLFVGGGPDLDLALFGPFWSIFRQILTILDPFGAYFKFFYGPKLDLGSFWPILGAFCGSGPGFGQYLAHLGRGRPEFGPFLAYFGGFLAHFDGP